MTLATLKTVDPEFKTSQKQIFLKVPTKELNLFNNVGLCYNL